MISPREKFLKEEFYLSISQLKSSVRDTLRWLLQALAHGGYLILITSWSQGNQQSVWNRWASARERGLWHPCSPTFQIVLFRIMLRGSPGSFTVGQKNHCEPEFLEKRHEGHLLHHHPTPQPRSLIAETQWLPGSITEASAHWALYPLRLTQKCNRIRTTCILQMKTRRLSEVTELQPDKIHP